MGFNSVSAENQMVKANMGRRVGGYNVGGLVSFLKKEEGWRDEAYPDSGGVWTIGYGRTTNSDGSPVKKGQKTNRKAEDAWLEKRATADRNATEAYMKENNYELTDSAIDALASFRYNGGHGLLQSLTGNGTRDVDTILKKMPEYNKVTIDGKKVPIKGLSNRRAAEIELWNPAGANKAPPAKPDTPPTQTAGFQGAVTDAVSQALVPQQQAPVMHQPMIQSMAPQQPQFIPSVTQSGLPTTQKKQKQHWNGGGPVQHLNDGGWWNKLFGQEKKKQNEIVAVDPFQGTVTYANGVTQVDPNKAKILATTAGPAQPQQQYQPSPAQPTGPGYEPTLQTNMKGGGILNVPSLQGVPPHVQPQAPAQKGPSVRDQLSGSLRRSWDERHQKSPTAQTQQDVQTQLAVPVKPEFTDESLLQGSSQSIANANQPPKPPTDLSGMTPEQIGKLYDQGDPAAIAYAENEENQWRVGEGLNQSRLNQAVQGDDPTIQAFNQQKTDQLQRQLAGLQGTPEGAQVAQNGEGAQLNVPPARVPQLSDAQVAGELPQEAMPGQMNLPTDMSGPTFEGPNAREDAIKPANAEVGREAAIANNQQISKLDKAHAMLKDAGATSPEGAAKAMKDAAATDKTPAKDVNEVAAAGNEAVKNNPKAAEKNGKFLKGIFGDLIDDKELARMGVIFAGALLTGATPGQALAMSGQMYLQRIDAKEANKQSHVQKLITDGDYTVSSIAKYKESGNSADLVPNKKGAAIGQPTGKRKAFIVDGQKVMGVEYKDKETGAVVHVGPNGKPINQWSAQEYEPAFDKGTPEYRTRRSRATGDAEGRFKEISDSDDLIGEKDGKAMRHTNIHPKQAADEFWAWSEGMGLDPESDEALQIQTLAYRDAIADAKTNNVKPSRLRPYLESAVVKQRYGGPELFTTSKGKPVAQDKMNTLENQIKAITVGSPVTRDEVRSTIMAQWAELKKKDPKAVETYNNQADGGRSGFYNFMMEKLNEFQLSRG